MTELALAATETRPKWEGRRWLALAAVLIDLIVLVALVHNPQFSGFRWVALPYAVISCALIWWFVSAWGERLLALIAMWRPLAVVLLAGYFLFFAAQGRELGVSLMIEDGHWGRPIYLLVALVYWALNNWHSARLGVWRALKNGAIGELPDEIDPNEPARRVSSANTPWVYWGPRFLGVCAHLGAAVSLGLAARRDFGDGLLGLCLALTAFFIICLIIVIVYRYDNRKLSERSVGAATAIPSPTVDQGAQPTWKAEAGQAWRYLRFVLRLSWRFLLLLSIVLAIVAVCAQLFSGYVPLPPGFVLGTWAISELAVIYLTLISGAYRGNPLGPKASLARRIKDDAKERRYFADWSIVLFVVALPFVVWTFISAPSLGRVFGSMVIAFFAFGALLASLNALGLMSETLATAPWAARWTGARPGEPAKPAVFHAYVITGVIILCVINAWLLPFHAVRRCQENCGTPNQRLRVEQAAERWYDQARDAYKRSHGDALDANHKLPLLIVATAGGGIRAAYWTATVLDTVGGRESGVAPYLFAISGVSGGSVGATAYSTSLIDPKRNTSRSYLADDFLAPALASWLFKDTLASILPWSFEDRAAALEHGFEHASNGLMAGSFLSFFNPQPRSDSPTSAWRPILLLNATHEETGKRIIASQALVERNVFVDALDELDELGGDVPASTAAINSARFIYVSPAGNLGGNEGSLIDGGYFENFGALTALEIGREAEAALQRYVRKNRAEATPGTDERQLNAQWPEIKLTILMITSDPDLDKNDDAKSDKSQTLLRIDRLDARQPCVISATEPSPDHAAPPHYLHYPAVEDERESWPGIVENALSDFVANPWVNEFLAPFEGINSVRKRTATAPPPSWRGTSAQSTRPSRRRSIGTTS